MSNKESIFNLTYTLVQLTWGLLQNIPGFAIWLALLIRKPSRVHGYFHGAVVTHWDLPSSMGLGMFIFLGTHHQNLRYSRRVLVHEYGHTIQSCILGPLFLPVVGLPSLIWASAPVFEKWRTEGHFSYYDFYTESWADYEGSRVLKTGLDGRN